MASTVDMKRSTLHLLTGCTACGKTSLSLEWAERHDAEIVSCDSLLFYRGMDIGTAKPTPAELARVPHHMIDMLEVSERMDVKRYTELARAAVEEIEGRGRRVLVVGGSGFYLKSFFANVADDVPADAEVREEIEARLRAEGLDSLVAWIRELNPNGMGKLDLQNPRRVVRALERCLVSGLGLQELATRFAAQEPAFFDHDVQIVEIVRPEEELRSRIGVRARNMVRDGLIDEVRRLLDTGLKENPSAAGAIGYREVIEWMGSGEGDQGMLAAKIAANTWKLVRKQRSWFRSQSPEHRCVEMTERRSVDVAGLFGR